MRVDPRAPQPRGPEPEDSSPGTGARVRGGCRAAPMITVPELAAEALGSFLASDVKRRFGCSHARDSIPSVARLALECIGNSDALYHNVEHTMLVTLVGHDIMRGRALLAPTSPD